MELEREGGEDTGDDGGRDDVRGRELGAGIWEGI